MTAKQIIDRARDIWGKALSDEIAANRAVSPLTWLSDGLLALFSAKPFAKQSPTTGEYMTAADLETLAALSSESTTVDIAPKWAICLSHYVAAMGFYSDAENQYHNERAQEHMGLFTKFLGL